MKLLYCEACGDIVAPHRTAGTPRFCAGGCHAVWWVDPRRGILRLHERGGVWEAPRDGQDPDYHAWTRKRSPHRAWVLGLHNGLLHHPAPHDAASIRGILEETPPTYLFKALGSLVIRIRPGESGDTDWAERLP
jgi:hypothetical protein